MNEFTRENLLIIGTITVVSTLIFYFFKKEKNTIDNKEIEYNNLKNEISDKLKELEKDFLNKSISYYLELELLKSNFSIEKRKEMLKDYPEVFSEPKIKWDNFIIINEEGNILNKLLEEKIKDYRDKDSYTVKASFNYMLLEKAEKIAMEIIKEEEKKFNQK